jgi:hypothetical protein
MSVTFRDNYKQNVTQKVNAQKVNAQKVSASQKVSSSQKALNQGW